MTPGLASLVLNTRRIRMQNLAVSLAEAEKLTSISRFTLRRLISRGLLKFVRVGRRLVIPLPELEKLVLPTVNSDDAAR
jgi:excisionase family DNA binding protein